jgi:hypothetical protein
MNNWESESRHLLDHWRIDHPRSRRIRRRRRAARPLSGPQAWLAAEVGESLTEPPSTMAGRRPRRGRSRMHTPIAPSDKPSAPIRSGSTSIDYAGSLGSQHIISGE